jgi:hypothetical protein
LKEEIRDKNKLKKVDMDLQERDYSTNEIVPNQNVKFKKESPNKRNAG